MIPAVQVLVWFVLLALLGVAGYWFFQGGATPLSGTALAIAAMLYLGAMLASVYVSARRHNSKQAQ
jgi:zinc transporter ZupT